MAAKHTVKVVETFDYTHKRGALVVDGKEICPAEERVSTYKEGDVHKFPNKADALAFAKFHAPKVVYIGKV